jgi:hypothetical protein
MVSEVEAVESEDAEEERKQDGGSVMFAVTVWSPLHPSEVVGAITDNLRIHFTGLIPRVVCCAVLNSPVPVRQLPIVTRVLPLKNVTAVH